MRLPRGVTVKQGRLFGRIYAKGGETSYALGSASDPGPALQRYYTIRSLIRNGTDPGAIKDALNGELGLATFAHGPTEPDANLTVAEAARRWIRERISQDLDPKNATDTERRIENCLIPFLGSKSIRDVRRADCHAFKGHIRATRPGL